VSGGAAASPIPSGTGGAGAKAATHKKTAKASQEEIHSKAHVIELSPGGPGDARCRGAHLKALCKSSGSLAILLAILRASSRVSHSLVDRSAKLFHERLGRRIRKTPAIIRFAVLQSYIAMPRLDVSRIVKAHDPTA
jgi:hypothetical protein